MNDAPQLLIEWSSPWEEFVAALGPALRRSPPRVGFETRAGLFPWRGMIAVLLLEIAVLVATIVMPFKGIQPTTSQATPPAPDVIYFSANELPRTEDLGGAAGGKAGRSGGASMRHTQAIRVARDEVVRERVVDAPQLNLPKSDSQIRNLLAFRADPGPAPAEALPLNRRAPQMAVAVAPPPPEMQAAMQRPAPQMANPAVVPPPIEISQHDLTRRSLLAPSAVVPPPVELSQHDLTRRSLLAPALVVPPPVSAPAEITSRTARLTLPAEAVVAPRPEISNATQSRRMNNDFNQRVVAPPVDLSAVRTPTSATALSGRQTVAPPPVEIQSVPGRAVRGLGSAAVAPPPVELQNVQPHAVRGLGNAAVAAPPSEIASLHTGRSLNAPNVSVLPPPDSSSTSSHNSSGGAGTGKAASSSSAGVVVSPQPGNKPGLPANSEKATLAMSPAGSTTPGAGGSGNGGSIGHGASSGSAPAGVGSGSTAVGAGKGASPYDRPGNSPTPGPGGAGNMSNGTSRVPGVSVSGGNNVVTLPSFGPAPDPASAGHSTAKGAKNGITIVASPRAGGALNLYGALKGDRVYTIYLSTAAGTAVMQFADPDSAAHLYDTDLTAPQAIRVNVPSDAPPTRLLIACVLDQNGTLHRWHVLQADSSDFSAKILAALPDWKFTPAFRGSQAVEVNAILGFGVDTK
ncbi:MAG TPA: hypothetical protein VKJ01_20135 [Candidatus Solibacter sp.]|nr:hypothetical protein [Candidatus Solibacter sp.]